eukprot:SAG25_NODE_12199_length_285_cov_0.838710_1_plen_25_part_10
MATVATLTASQAVESESAVTAAQRA